MVWGLGQPSAAHWRQWRDLAAAIGLNVGRNVAAIGYLLEAVSGPFAGGGSGLRTGAFARIMTVSSQGLGECPRPISSKAQSFWIF